MSLYSKLTNNSLINNLLIATGLDAEKELSVGQWKSFKYDGSKSIQQNAGFSHTAEVEEAIEIVKKKLQQCVKENVPLKSHILDIGCGPGIYMKLLSDRYHVSGVDISEEMLSSASKLLPDNPLYLGNFLSITFPQTYKAIYSISVLEYVPVSKIKLFFEKCASLLDNQGVLFIQYPHALSRRDLWYPDRNYINYSPALISRMAADYFTVIENKQSFDQRDTCYFDEHPYETHSKTFKNGYLLIARKK